MESTAFIIKGYIPFPCCPKEKVMPYEGASGLLSQKCPNCGKFAEFDLDEMVSRPGKAAKGVVRQINRQVYRPSR